MNMHLRRRKHYNQDVQKCVKTMMEDDTKTPNYMVTSFV